jgi:hypothetical protein
LVLVELVVLEHLELMVIMVQILYLVQLPLRVVVAVKALGHLEEKLVALEAVAIIMAPAVLAIRQALLLAKETMVEVEVDLVLVMVVVGVVAQLELEQTELARQAAMGVLERQIQLPDHL